MQLIGHRFLNWFRFRSFLLHYFVSLSRSWSSHRTRFLSTRLLYVFHYLYCVIYFLCFLHHLSHYPPYLSTCTQCTAHMEISVFWYDYILFRIAATTIINNNNNDEIIIVYSAIAKQWNQITGTQFTIIFSVWEKRKISAAVCWYRIIPRNIFNFQTQTREKSYLFSFYYLEILFFQTLLFVYRT